MKITYRIPTEQYSYIEIEHEAPDTWKPQEIKESYDNLVLVFKSKEGLSTKDFNAALDEYLQTNSFKNADETYFKMSPEQQKIIQEIKKCVKRITAKDYKDLGEAEAHEQHERDNLKN